MLILRAGVEIGEPRVIRLMKMHPLAVSNLRYFVLRFLSLKKRSLFSPESIRYNGMASRMPSMTHVEDLKDDSDPDLPFLARHFYHDYRLPALQLVDEALGKTIEFLSELFPALPMDALEEFRQLLELERVVKFCQIAENLGAIAVGFKPSYENEKEEMLGLYKTLTEYAVGDVTNFYRDVNSLSLELVARFLGYPYLSWQRPCPRKFIELSCRNAREDLAQIGSLYAELRLLYDAYKHGYRMTFGKHNLSGDDVTVYVDVNKKQKALVLSKELKKNLHEKSALCFHILNVMFTSHRERARFEVSGTREGPMIVTLYRRNTDPKPAPGDLNFIYKTRGQMWAEDNDAAKQIYQEHAQELEQNHAGKYVAINIDQRTIVAIDSSLAAIRGEIYKNPPKGRIMFRQVGRRYD